MLKADGLESLPVPGQFGTGTESDEHGCEIWHLSDGMSGAQEILVETPYRMGNFTNLHDPKPLVPVPAALAADPLLYATVDGNIRMVEVGTAPATGSGSLLDKVKEAIAGTEPGTHTKS
ncbi:hypothetical protein [Kineosporia sp. NBRC 101731]|uniref:hypothetical protein n=1 Tax=Kineosporia sp. NBRC 101731 TaxID=3032199 RepID=UPI0024A34AD4|nr:hypothetical protein [Kineosporia sp. NBRC 101731]GLY28813.1 hypothetical protein Kisp02_21780 [Kineosporia sp. NBRC 101731]